MVRMIMKKKNNGKKVWCVIAVQEIVTNLIMKIMDPMIKTEEKLDKNKSLIKFAGNMIIIIIIIR